VGAREALKVLRRHRVIETYLCEQLGYSWEDVHVEAERLEHAASDGLVERMAAALEHPSHDPHGAPIPTSGGEIEATDFSTLAEAAPGSALRIRAVSDEDPARLRSMDAQGLTPGARLSVDPVQASADVVTVLLADAGGIPLAVRRDLAKRIYVIPEEA
jgi:DtxR family Mn-dependent transcriptional regulator